MCNMSSAKMTLNVRVSGSVWSSLIFDDVRQQGDKEGFLIGEVSMQEMTNISDSQINSTTRETTVNVISHTICLKPFSFYNRLGQVDREKLEGVLKNNCDNVVGWFRCRSGSIPEPSLRENAIHHHLRELLGAHYQTFLFGIFGEGSNLNHTTITYYYNFYTFTNGLFSPQKVAIENLGDTAQSEYKHGSSLNTESSGSDSYRDILTSYKKDMIDKDGYLQGMQGIKKTNEAIHDKMKSLKDSVVKSEDSVQKLVTEIKALGQKVDRVRTAVEMESEPAASSAAEQPLASRARQGSLNRGKAEGEENKTDRNSKAEDSTPTVAADTDPFSSLIVDMKASISSPVKPRSHSDRPRRTGNDLGSRAPEFKGTEPMEDRGGSPRDAGDGTRPEAEPDSESTHVPSSPLGGLETSGSQTF